MIVLIFLSAKENEFAMFVGNVNVRHDRDVLDERDVRDDNHDDVGDNDCNVSSNFNVR